ncbi:unnamed protein product [Urochloa decumbens]|uniref:F-box domain-containing protein n=1 Tax=Urochloa decumbens TaxID=240449 RepID=A0ABC8VWB9_9POAL
MPPCTGLDVLPDEVLHHILGFLEAQESVRTCVLARRWRHLWKWATGVRIVAHDGKSFLGSVHKLCNFFDSLLRHRNPTSPLHTCELTFTSFGPWMSGFSSEDEDRWLCLVNAWFWRAVSCQVQVLILRSGPTLALDERPVASRHLTRLELECVMVNTRFLDFSNCPLLEHLEFRTCFFDADDGSRLRICSPSLVSLILDDIWGMAPMLESMPSLVKAVVATEDSLEYCRKVECNCEFCGNSYSIGDDTGNNGCVLLKGLSEAKDLALISAPEQEDRQQRERKGTLRPMEGSAAILEHLKIIEIRCDAVDEKICKLTLFLCAFNIRLSLN